MVSLGLFRSPEVCSGFFWVCSDLLRSLLVSSGLVWSLQVSFGLFRSLQVSLGVHWVSSGLFGSLLVS